MTIDEEWEALGVIMRLQGEHNRDFWSGSACREINLLFDKEGLALNWGKDTAKEMEIKTLKRHKRVHLLQNIFL